MDVSLGGMKEFLTISVIIMFTQFLPVSGKLHLFKIFGLPP